MAAILIALGGWLCLPTPVSAVLTAVEVAKLTANDAAPEDELGKSVAVSGDLAVVGAPLDDDNGGGSGSAYIFARNQGGGDIWGQVAKLTPSDGSAADVFGHAVAVSGDTVIVGAPFDDDACPADLLCNSGSAYVFKRNQGGADAWGQVAKLTGSTSGGGAEFGFAVAIDNDTAVVGAVTGSGSAYVFERNQDGAEMWGEVEEIGALDSAAGDEFGVSVGISGDRIVVGALQGDGAFTNSGSAYVFERNSGGTDSWDQRTELSAVDGAPGDEFGRSVGIHNDTIVVGASRDGDAGADSGSAYVFERNQGGIDAWGQTQKLTASGAAAGDEFGWAVAIASNGIAVGAYLADNHPDAGAVYLFERNVGAPTSWSEVSKVTASDQASDDRLGFGVALTAETLLAGAPRDDDDGDRSGSAYVFARTGAIWQEVDKPVASDAVGADKFGTSAAISGEVAAVGSPRALPHNSAGIGVGAVYIYRRSQESGSESWTEEIKVSSTSLNFGEAFGSAVGLSGDTLVVGSSADDWACPSDPFSCNSGGVSFFERNQGGEDAWGGVNEFGPSDGEAQDRFGSSVAISGDTAVVGAPLDDDACPADPDCNSGSVYVFQRNQGGSLPWGEVAKLTASSADAGDRFGTSVAIDGDTVVVGAPKEDDLCPPAFPDCDSGAVYVFERNQGGADQWGEVARQIPSGPFPGNEQLGTSVAIDGDRAIAGAAFGDADAAGLLFDTGTVYIFERNQGGVDQWGEVTQIVPDDAMTLDAFGGFGVAISGDRILASSATADGACVPFDFACNSGSAYLFERNQSGGEKWGQAAKLTASDPEAGDLFGSAVALDGSVALVGSPFDDDACSMDPACDSGSAYLYRQRAPEGDLSITKSDGRGEIEATEATAYEIVVSNAGPDDAEGVLVIDVVDPAQFLLNRTTWTCAPAPGSDPGTNCPASGDATELAAGVEVDIFAGDSVFFDVATQIGPTPVGPIVNTARILTPSYRDLDSGNDSDTDTNLLLVPGACEVFQDRVLADQIIDTPTSVTACETVTLGPNLQIIAPGVLEVGAGAEIRFEGDVAVLAGAGLALVIDPSLLP
ncbi:MAG: hypothetical protein ACE5GX_07845 [Thermoanaerobaculia bacterium]